VGDKQICSQLLQQEHIYYYHSKREEKWDPNSQQLEKSDADLLEFGF
jgi:hypothetical protein